MVLPAFKVKLPPQFYFHTIFIRAPSAFITPFSTEFTILIPILMLSIAFTFLINLYLTKNLTDTISLTIIPDSN